MRNNLFLSIFTLALFSSSLANSSVCNQTVPESGLYYVNGIATSHNLAQQSAEQIGDKVGGKVILNYNQTNGVLLDLIEAAKQKYGTFNSERAREILSPTTPISWRDAIIQSWHLKFNAAFVRSPDLKEHVARYTTDLRAGKKVFVIAHSQGNFYANESRLMLTATLGPEQLQGFGVFGLAVPANNVSGNSASSATYLTNNLDIITAVPGSMPPNVTLLNADGSTANISGLAAHGLIETYLSSSFTLVKQVVSGFKAMKSSLPSPSPVCGTEAMDLVSYFSGTYPARSLRGSPSSIVVSSSGTVSVDGRSLISSPASISDKGVTTSLSHDVQTLAIETALGDRFTQSFKSGAFDTAYLYSTSAIYSPQGTSTFINTSGTGRWIFDRYSWLRDYLNCSDSSVRIASLSADQLFLSGLQPIDLTQFITQTVTASPTPDAQGATVTVGMNSTSGAVLGVAFSASSGVRHISFTDKSKNFFCNALN